MIHICTVKFFSFTNTCFWSVGNLWFIFVNLWYVFCCILALHNAHMYCFLSPFIAHLFWSSLLCRITDQCIEMVNVAGTTGRCGSLRSKVAFFAIATSRHWAAVTIFLLITLSSWLSFISPCINDCRQKKYTAPLFPSLMIVDKIKNGQRKPFSVLIMRKKKCFRTAVSWLNWI